MATIGSLVLSLRADAGPFARDLAAASKAVADAGKRMAATGSDLGAGMGEAVAGLGASVSEGAAQVGRLVATTRELAQTAASAEQAVQSFGQRAGPGLAALVGEGSAAVQGLSKALQESGAAASAAGAHVQGLADSVTDLQSAAEGQARGGDEGGWLVEALRAMRSFAREAAPFIAVVGGLGFIFKNLKKVLGPLARTLAVLLPTALRAAGAAFAALLAPIDLTVAAIVGAGALIAAFVLFREEIYHGVVVALRALVDAFGRLREDPVKFAKDMYLGVKEWLVDRFAGIVEGVRGAVDRVTGFFRQLYQDVVAESFVPDLVEGIGRHFALLEGKMVAPAHAATGSVRSAFGQMADGVGREMDRFADDLVRGEADFRSFVRSILRDFQQLLSAQITGGSGGAGGIFSSLLSGLVGSIFSGGGAASLSPFGESGPSQRQHGGPLRAFQPALVGERGPELFVPRQSGTVIPNSGLSGGLAGATVYIDARGADAAALARVERSLVAMNANFERRAVGAVVAARGRNPRLFGPRSE